MTNQIITPWHSSLPAYLENPPEIKPMKPQLTPRQLQDEEAMRRRYRELPYARLLKPDYFNLNGVTGAVPFEKLEEFARRWSPLANIRYGFLVSPSKGSTGRYIDLHYLRELDRYLDIAFENEDRYSNYSLHICGNYLEDFEEMGFFGFEDFIPPAVNAVQFNIASKPHLQNENYYFKVREWSEFYGKHPVLQLPKFPEEDIYFGILIDNSLGKGVVPDQWPDSRILSWDKWTDRVMKRSRTNTVAYAGGINAGNIAEVIRAINVASLGMTYNLDMETGVMDESDIFSLSKCEDIMYAAYQRNPEDEAANNDGEDDGEEPPLTDYDYDEGHDDNY